MDCKEARLALGLLFVLLVLIDLGAGQVKQHYSKERNCPQAKTPMMVKQVGWGVEGRAYLTLPPGLRIAPSKIKGAGFGVLSETFIPKYTWLGDYEGEIVPLHEGKKISWYAWQIQRDSKIIGYVDAYRFHTSSYHRYINTPVRHRDENVIALQCYGRVFYVTNKDIIPGDELLVFYGVKYTMTLKIDINEYYDVSPKLREAGLDLNNRTHRVWVENAGLQLHQTNDPPSSLFRIVRNYLWSKASDIK